MKVLAPLVILAALGGCACDPAQYAPVEAVRTAAPMCAPAPAASPCAPAMAPAPQVAFAVAQPVGVEFRVGAAEQVRAGLTVPPAVAGCLVTGAYKALMVGIETINCIGNNLIPTPVPTQRFVYAPAPQFAPAPAAAPCR